MSIMNGLKKAYKIFWYVIGAFTLIFFFIFAVFFDCDEKKLNRSIENTTAVVQEEASAAVATVEVSGGGQGGGTDQEKAVAELEKEVVLFVKGEWCGTCTQEGVFFKFQGYVEEGSATWTATNKKAIGDCPAGSEWWLNRDEDGTNSKVPPKCKSITPKVFFNLK